MESVDNVPEGSPLPNTRREASPLLRTVTFRAPSSAFNPANAQQLLVQVVGTKNPSQQKVSESLDYEPVQNKIFYDRMKASKANRKFYGYTGSTLAKFLVTVLTGIITGVFAVIMTKSVGFLIEWKMEFIQETLDEPGKHGVLLAFIYHSLYSSALVAIAVALVQYWAPASAGAGVTLVMAYLNGNHIPNLLRLRTLVTKLVGTICAVSAGMPMGPEGPMVHIGACTASAITYFECKCMKDGLLFGCFGTRKMRLRHMELREKLKVLDDIVSDADHREFVSAGVSAGISAAFGAPIGGVLFAMEEACSFWSRKAAWRCFIASVFATFTLAQLNRGAQHGMIAFSGLHTMENRDWLMQLPFIIFNAGMAGLLGAAFNSLRMLLWRLRASKTMHCLRIAEVVGTAILCQLFAFFFSWAAGKCVDKNPEWGNKYGMRFQCEEGKHNDLATLFLSSSHETIIGLFSLGHEPGQAYVKHFTNGSLALFTVAYLLLMSVGAGVAIPGGLFMPSIVVGASWGGLWGGIVRGWLPKWNIQPGLYGIMASAGVLGGVFRSAISLVVLVIEGTRGIEYMFGVILSIVVANWVAHHIHHDGVYESELERIGNIFFLRDEPPHRLYTLTAEMIMATGVYGFKAIESAQKIMEVLRTTTHNGFPVFNMDGIDDSSADLSEGGRLEGLVLRSQLLVLLQRRHFCNAQGRPIGRDPDEKCEVELETEMRTFYRHYFTHNRYVASTTAPLDALQLDTPTQTMLNLQDVFVDLRPYMNRSPFTVRKDCSASRAHQAFVGLGLRHLIVVDNHNHVAGIITRKDLDHAAGHGWWRVSQVAPEPKHRNQIGHFFRQIPSVGFLKKLVPSKSDPNLSTMHHEEGDMRLGAAHAIRNHHSRSRSTDERDEEIALRLAIDGEEGNYAGQSAHI